MKSLHLTKTSAPNAAASSATGQANTIDSIHKIDLNAVGQIGGTAFRVTLKARMYTTTT